METRKLTKIGGGRSFSVNLPIDYVKKLKWRERQKLAVDLEGRKIIIRDWKRQK